MRWIGRTLPYGLGSDRIPRWCILNVRWPDRTMKKILGVTLGIMTALGGFVDLGQIVFTLQAGALFGYQLLWAIALGTVAIVIYMEMCGRVAVVAKEPVFAVVRTCLGF